MGNSRLIDEMLKFMAGNSYKLHLNFERGKIRELGFTDIEIRAELDILVSEGKLIIYFDKSNFVYILTREGVKAADVGIESYEKEKEEDGRIDRDVKLMSIKSYKLSRIAVWVSIASVIAAAAPPFILNIM